MIGPVEACLTLIELAIAFVLNHPGVTSAIVGPRTVEQLESYLPAADIALSTEVLDRIHKLVAPVSVSRSHPGGGVAVFAGQATVATMVLDIGVSREVGGWRGDGADVPTGVITLVKPVVRLGVGVRPAPLTGAHPAFARTRPVRVARRPVSSPIHP